MSASPIENRISASLLHFNRMEHVATYHCMRKSLVVYYFFLYYSAETDTHHADMKLQNVS